jgi:hypothetical protein
MYVYDKFFQYSILQYLVGYIEPIFNWNYLWKINLITRHCQEQKSLCMFFCERISIFTCNKTKFGKQALARIFTTKQHEEFHGYLSYVRKLFIYMGLWSEE